MISLELFLTLEGASSRSVPVLNMSSRYMPSNQALQGEVTRVLRGMVTVSLSDM